MPINRYFICRTLTSRLLIDVNPIHKCNLTSDDDTLNCISVEAPVAYIVEDCLRLNRIIISFTCSYFGARYKMLCYLLS